MSMIKDAAHFFRLLWSGVQAPQLVPILCKGCGKPLLPENAWMHDGCPCNSPSGINGPELTMVGLKVGPVDNAPPQTLAVLEELTPHDAVYAAGIEALASVFDKDKPSRTRTIYMQAPKTALPPVSADLPPGFAEALAAKPLEIEMPFGVCGVTDSVADYPGELVFPNYSVAPYDDVAIPGITTASHGKLLAMMAKRSPQWRKKALSHIALHPFCAVCGYTLHLIVHHIIPFHVRPDLELVDANLITIGQACPSGNHHYLFGHFLNWKNYNPQVSLDAARFLLEIPRRAA